MAPTRMIATIKSEVPTGRSMKIRDGFMSRPGLLVGLRRPAGTAAVGLASPLPVLVALRGSGAVAVRGRRCDPWPAGSARVAARAADLGAVAQAIGAVDHDLVAKLQAAQDLLLLAIADAELD